MFNPIIFEGEYDCKKIIIFFRYIFIASLSVMAFTDYIIINQELLSGSIVFKQEVINPQLSIVDLVRNQGCFWDSRILGIFSYLYLYLVLTNKVKYKGFDILLSIVITVSTLSRGPIVVELFLLAGYFVFSQKISLKRVLLMLSAVVGIFIIAIQFVDEQIYSFLETFLPTSGGALEQRQGFKDYALNEFYSNPLGSGLGSISSPNVKKVINVGGQIYEKAGDAYLFINLAELGIIGFSLFLLSTVEIIYKKKVLSIALLLGYLIQLTGTNVPDMGMYFYVFITLAHSYSFLNTEKIGDEVKSTY